MQAVYIVLAAYAAISVVNFILYFSDKRKAIRGARRISERTLLSFSFFGGAVGGLAGMILCRHKTKHWYFWVVNFVGLAWQAALAALLFFMRV